MGAFTDLLQNFLHPKGLDSANAKKLQDVLNRSDAEGKQLATEGVNLVSNILIDMDVPITEVGGTIDALSELLAEVQQDPIDPTDFQTKVLRADIALTIIDGFRIGNVKSFYVERVKEIKQKIGTTFSKTAVKALIADLTKMDTRSLTRLIETINDVLVILTNVAQLFHFVDDMSRTLADGVLQQSNPERYFRSGSHRSRKSLQSL